MYKNNSALTFHLDRGIPGLSTSLDFVRQGPTALAVGAGGGLFGHFLSPLLFLFFLPLSGRRPDID